MTPKCPPGDYERWMPHEEFFSLSPEDRDKQQEKFDMLHEIQEEAAAVCEFQRPDTYPSNLPVKSHPAYTDDECTTILHAILDAKFDLKVAYAQIALDRNMLSKDLILRWDALKSEPVKVLAGFLNQHGEDMWKVIHSRYGLSRAAQIIEEGNERVAADLIKYSGDRSYGKPVIKGEVTHNFVSHQQVEDNFRKNKAKYGSGEWYSVDASQPLSPPD